MATSKKRLALALTDPQYDLLSRLAKLQKRSRASVVMELLETSLPVLERVAVVGEAWVKSQQQAKEGMQASMEAAEAELLPIAEKALGQFDMFLADIHKRLETGNAAVRSPTHAAVGRGVASARRKGLTPVRVTTGVRSHGRGKKPAKRRVRS